MSKVEDRLKELGLSLPEAPAKAGSYAPAKRFGGNLYFVSGCGPSLRWEGRLPAVRRRLCCTPGHPFC